MPPAKPADDLDDLERAALAAIDALARHAEKRVPGAGNFVNDAGARVRVMVDFLRCLGARDA